MSIQSFAEKLLSDIDGLFEDKANNLLNESRQMSQKTAYIAGEMDGLSEAVKQIKETYRLFVKTEEKESDETKALY